MNRDHDRTGAGPIDSVLDGLLRRIRHRFLVHGLGWMVAAVLGSGLIYFVLDRALVLPTAVRWILSLAILTYLVIGFRRRVVYPIRRPLEQDDVALAIEHNFPQLEQRLISAHQLDVARERGQLRDQSPAMIERVVREASEGLGELRVDRVLDSRRTARVWGVAAVVSAVALVLTLAQPVHVWTMVQRALGLSVEYPRETRLIVELPEENPDYRIERGTGREVLVTLAAGADLPVLVRAEGVVPREVFLVVEGGRGISREIAATRRPGDRFRHVFRRVRGEFEFQAKGGDDPRGDTRVRVRTIRPPLVGDLEARLTPPAYTGREPETRPGGTIEALIGTDVRLDVTATEAVDSATLAFLDSGTEIELEPIGLEDDSGEKRRFVANFVVSVSDRYEVRLVSPDGLRNPRPGTYPVVAIEDHDPVGKTLLPSGDDIHVVTPGAFVPVRVEAKDDFGLESIEISTKAGRELAARTESLLAPAEAGGTTATVRTTLLSLGELIPERPNGPRAGETITLTVTLTDNRRPEPGRTELSARQVHVVAQSELLRRISGHFRRIRESVERALVVQQERRELLEDLIAAPPDTGALRGDPRLVSAEVGQSRVLSSAQRIRTGLMQAYDAHLFNRLEGEDSIHAARTVELFLEVHREIDRGEAWLPEFYRRVAEEQTTGRIGAMEKTLDPILAMVLGADRIVEQHGRTASEALDAASVAATGSALFEHLKAALGAQSEIERELSAMLARLDEWNEFQDLIQQARVLRDAQRDVESRTRSIQEQDR